MLYLTTRNASDTYTSYRAIHSQQGMDGGLFLPFRFPSVDMEQLKDKSFGSIVSEILGLFFYDKITFWDVEFCMGKRPVKIVELPQNISVVQLWNRETGDIAQLEQAIYAKLAGEQVDAVPSWPQIAIRIAFLFATFAELQKSGQPAPDVAIPEGECRTLMAVRYAKAMGLPVGQILCGCPENSPLWELMHLGSTKPVQDTFPAELERLITACFGAGEAEKLHTAVTQKSAYTLPAWGADALREGISCAVISQGRINSAISGIYRSNGFVAGPFTAMSYCALQDHRAKTGGNRPTLILAGKSPLCHSAIVADALQVSYTRLTELMR